MALGGCTLPQWWHKAPPSTAEPPAAPALFTTATPAYLLVFNRQPADIPTRLVVLHVRLSTGEESPLRFSEGELVVRLPDGGAARVFDHPRAVELLRRTVLVDADPTHRAAEPGPSGRMVEGSQEHLRSAVIGKLLGEGDVAAGKTLEGYIVVDTGQPLSSFDGVEMEVVAHRLTDGSAVSGTYQFATGAAAPPAD